MSPTETILLSIALLLASMVCALMSLRAATHRCASAQERIADELELLVDLMQADDVATRDPAIFPEAARGATELTVETVRGA